MGLSPRTIEELDHSIQESSDFKIQVRLKRLNVLLRSALDCRVSTIAYNTEKIVGLARMFTK